MHKERCQKCKHINCGEGCPCMLGEDVYTAASDKSCDDYSPRFESSADGLKNMQIIFITEFKKNVIPRLSSRIDTSKIKTVEDIYEQREAFYGANRTVSPNLDMLPNLIERVSFWAWWIVEDENKHHCIVH